MKAPIVCWTKLALVENDVDALAYLRIGSYMYAPGYTLT